MPFSWPPGVLYVAQNTSKLVLPLLPVLIVHRFSLLNLSSYVWILIYVLAMPSVTFFTILTQRLREDRDIKRLGARRVPEVHSRWPGGLDNSARLSKAVSEGCIADIWEEYVLERGENFNIRLFWEDVIFTTEPENIKTILATDFDTYEKGWKFKWYTESLLGTGVFNSDGDMWKFHREMTRPFFVRERITDFELFDRHAETVISHLKSRFSQGEAVDFQDLIGRFTLDSASEFMFGSCVHSLSAQLPYAHNSPRQSAVSSQQHPSDQFVAAFSQAQQQVSVRNWLADVWPLAEFWKDETKASMKIIHAYIDPILKNALIKKDKAAKDLQIGADDSSERQETLLDHLVLRTDDHVILRDAILNVMLAGRDTTMALVTFVVYCLSQYPDILVRLRAEILKQVGPTRRPTFDDIKACRYLRAVINETLRLYPPVPFNVRRCKHPTIWPSLDGGKPYYIPGGIDIGYSVWLMHRRTDLWGPDAREYDPDRFLDARLHKYLTPNPFIFLPFNAGPRICMGQQFAYNETSFMLVRLLQSFDSITLDSAAQPPDSRPPARWQSAAGRKGIEKIWPKAHLVSYVYKGLWLKMGEVQHTDTI